MDFVASLDLSGDRGGSEEPIAEHPVRTQAYYKYVEESEVATTKVYA